MMSEAERLVILKNLLSDTIKYANDEFSTANDKLFDSYQQEPYGNEEEGRSQVVTSDHYDLVESDMPSLARVFLGANKVLEFKPFGQHDAEEASQKTKYADYLIRQQADSFKVLHDWLKVPGFAKCGVVKFWSDDEEVPEYVTYADLSEDELVVLMEDLKTQPKVDRVEIDSQEDGDTGLTVKFRVVKKTKKIRIAGVPSNSFIISRGAKSKNDAAIVGDECIKKKYELLAEGFDAELVKKLAPNSMKGDEDMRRRFDGQGGWDQKSGYHWHNDEVTIQNLYAMIDADEDGIPERRYIMKCGEEILTDEPYGIVPYALLSQVLMPHAAIGKSRGEQAARYQKEKTAVKRGVMDNIYSVNRPGMAVDGSQGGMGGSKVDLDELLSQRIGRVVRTDGSPLDKLMPLVVPYIGDSALQVIQYIDTEKSNTLGQMLTNQGLNGDKFYKETATRFEGIDDANTAKIELVARVYAETGWRELYEGVIWTAQHYQDEACEIMVLGKPLLVDPRKWRYEHYCQSCIGLGAGDTADAIDNLGVMLQTQMGFMATGSPIVDSQKIYNTLDDMLRAMGKPDPSRYFNNPEIPDQQLLAMLEQAMKQNQMLQQMANQNPLAEAELLRAQAKMAEVQTKEQNSMRQFVAKMAQENAQFAQKMRLEADRLAQQGDQFAATLAKDLTALELQNNRDVPGAVV